MRKLVFAGGVMTAFTLTFTAAAQPVAGPAKVGQTSAGPTLTDPAGMTLYTYSRDMTGYSNCNDACAAAWPPFAAPADAKSAGDWSIVHRDDGKPQWAYKGAALYHDAKDAKPGDAAGEGADGGKWHAAKP
jgi:predicted lipoprotein with Yx(FWY)xxD motif